MKDAVPIITNETSLNLHSEGRNPSTRQLTFEMIKKLANVQDRTLNN
jgi:hypothetical protein